MPAVEVVGPGSVSRANAAIQIIGPDSVDRNIQEGRIIGPDGVDRVFFLSLGAGGGLPGISVTPTVVDGTDAASRSTRVTSATATVTVSGGVAPYTYAWTGVGDPMTATAPSSAASAFYATLNPQDEKTATWTCTVTDAAGFTGSVFVDVDLRNIGFMS